MKYRLVAAAVLALSLGACSGNKNNEPKDSQGSSATQSSDQSSSGPTVQGTGQSGSTQGTGNINAGTSSSGTDTSSEKSGSASRTSDTSSSASDVGVSSTKSRKKGK